MIEKAERGEEVIIARGKKPVVRLVPGGCAGDESHAEDVSREFEVTWHSSNPPLEELEGWE